MTDNKRKNPKIYMRMAVDVMKKSISEGKKDKPSPHVGAVLVFPDGTADTAYRGELRAGDHAEYAVLDKKNQHRELSGCWFFSTLEPCAPGARNAPKVSCAERIVNARISEVWFGIEDKNPKVDHGGIVYLLDNYVKVHQFDPEFHKEIEDANKRFNTWAEIKNIEAKAKKSKPKDYLNEKAMATNMNSLSEEALQKFLTESGRKWKPNSDTFLQELKDMELLEYDKKTSNYLPTGNAILLFGKRPRNKFPQAAVKAKVDFGNGELGAETFDDPLVLIPDKVDNWVRKVLPASIDHSKFKAKQVPAFPVEVIREALINAIVHRDYAKDGAKVQLEIKPDRIIIKSPGAPAPPVTIESLKNFTATSWSRNKKLTFIFNEMGYMEESEIGMDTFRSLRDKHHLPLPIINYDGSNVIVIFPRTADAVKKVSGKEAIDKLNEVELAGYDFVRSRKEVSKKEYAVHFDLSDKVAQNQLRKMRDLDLIGDNGEPHKSNKYKYVYKE
ncbi:MAG: ATP-dependent DNA helicase RecG [Candidatus Scalindua rubra]|uniref:ATP-dependent DNA helicase RecG n=1 Tax=Candidatus Scalindua rubra TaxID=1872076 RepID=A0A1E3X376_9BACT|nr:MAG: ATP-dependent DNA helicase RecG [Candidatus Scalindua rubra]